MQQTPTVKELLVLRDCVLTRGLEAPPELALCRSIVHVDPKRIDVDVLQPQDALGPHSEGQYGRKYSRDVKG